MQKSNFKYVYLAIFVVAVMIGIIAYTQFGEVVGSAYVAGLLGSLVVARFMENI